MTDQKKKKPRTTPKKEEPEVERLKFDLNSLTGRETILFEQITGKSVFSLQGKGIDPDDIDPDNPDPALIEEAGLDMTTMLAFAFIVKHRTEPDLDWDEFLDQDLTVSLAGIDDLPGRAPLDPTNAND